VGVDMRVEPGRPTHRQRAIFLAACAFAVTSCAVALVCRADTGGTRASAAAGDGAPAEIVTVDRRWTSRIDEFPGELRRASNADGFEIEVAFPPKSNHRMGVTDGVQVVVGRPGRPVAGHVIAVKAAEEKSGAPMRVTVRIPPAPDLEPGLDARLRIAVRDRPVLALPDVAIRRSSDGKPVVVLIDPSGATEERTVRTGERLRDGTVEIVSGLAPGDRVVLP
jgi:hypothetical protein